MIYSDLYLRKKTSLIPLIIMFFISISLMAGVVQTKMYRQINHANKDKLTGYEIVNLAPTQNGIYWESSISEEGWVRYGAKKEDLATAKAYDDRDISGKPQKYNKHIVTLSGLQENTDYYFQIFNKKGAYQIGGNKLFVFRTPKKDTQRLNLKPAYGKVLTPNGKPASNVIVMMKIEGKIPLLALSKETGEWLIPLNTIIDKTTTRMVREITEGQKAEVEFISEGNKSSYVVTTLTAVNPMLQTIVLGQNYNLLAKGDVLSASTNNINPEQKTALMVVYPRENALIPAAKPLIKGTGIPGNEVTVFINSKPQFSYRTKVDTNGEWRVLPTNPIGHGTYVAVVTSKDEKGGKITIKRNFIIAKNGEQVLGVATGEPTLIPTPLPSPTVLVIAPTISVTTPLPSVLPTLSISPTTIPQNPTVAPTVSEPPRTGIGSSTNLIIASFSLLILGAGLLLVF